MSPRLASLLASRFLLGATGWLGTEARKNDVNWGPPSKQDCVAMTEMTVLYWAWRDGLGALSLSMVWNLEKSLDLGLPRSGEGDGGLQAFRGETLPASNHLPLLSRFFFRCEMVFLGRHRAATEQCI